MCVCVCGGGGGGGRGEIVISPRKIPFWFPPKNRNKMFKLFDKQVSLGPG